MSMYKVLTAWAIRQDDGSLKGIGDVAIANHVESYAASQESLRLGHCLQALRPPKPAANGDAGAGSSSEGDSEGEGEEGVCCWCKLFPVSHSRTKTFAATTQLGEHNLNRSFFGLCCEVEMLWSPDALPLARPMSSPFNTAVCLPRPRPLHFNHSALCISISWPS